MLQPRQPTQTGASLCWAKGMNIDVRISRLYATRLDRNARTSWYLRLANVSPVWWLISGSVVPAGGYRQLENDGRPPGGRCEWRSEEQPRTGAPPGNVGPHFSGSCAGAIGSG